MAQSTTLTTGTDTTNTEDITTIIASVDAADENTARRQRELDRKQRELREARLNLRTAEANQRYVVGRIATLSDEARQAVLALRPDLSPAVSVEVERNRQSANSFFYEDERMETLDAIIDGRDAVLEYPLGPKDEAILDQYKEREKLYEDITPFQQALDDAHARQTALIQEAQKRDVELQNATWLESVATRLRYYGLERNLERARSEVAEKTRALETVTGGRIAPVILDNDLERHSLDNKEDRFNFVESVSGLTGRALVKLRWKGKFKHITVVVPAQNYVESHPDLRYTFALHKDDKDLKPFAEVFGGEDQTLEDETTTLKEWIEAEYDDGSDLNYQAVSLPLEIVEIDGEKQVRLPHALIEEFEHTL